MILHNFDPKYDFGAVLEQVTPKIRSQNHARGCAARVLVAFCTGFGVWPALKRLQNDILDQSYAKS